jgi:L-ascorbate metabolism protein UlaG (beta-lactamase superfamily)
VLRLGGAALITDPVLRRFLGPLVRHGARPDPALVAEAGTVLISHLHRDHLDLRSLRRLEARHVVVPRGGARVLHRLGPRDVHELDRGDEIELGGLMVRAVRAVHGGRRDPISTVSAPSLGYLIESRDRRVYFAGDTELFDGMADLGEVDLALLPVWGWGPEVGPMHLDPQSAARAVELIRPRVAVPIHWGTFYPLGVARLRPSGLRDPGPEFARLAAERRPESSVRVLAPGEGLDLE